MKEEKKLLFRKKKGTVQAEQEPKRDQSIIAHMNENVMMKLVLYNYFTPIKAAIKKKYYKKDK